MSRRWAEMMAARTRLLAFCVQDPSRQVSYKHSRDTRELSQKPFTLQSCLVCIPSGLVSRLLVQLGFFSLLADYLHIFVDSLPHCAVLDVSTRNPDGYCATGLTRYNR